MPYPDLTHPTIAEHEARDAREARRAAKAKGARIFTGPEAAAEYAKYQHGLEQRNGWIVRDYERGVERRDIAEAYGLSYNYVTKILADAGLNLAPRRHPAKATDSDDAIGGTDMLHRLVMARASETFLKRLFSQHILTDTIPPNMDRADFIDRCRTMGIITMRAPAKQARLQAVSA